MDFANLTNAILDCIAAQIEADPERASRDNTGEKKKTVYAVGIDIVNINKEEGALKFILSDPTSKDGKKIKDRAFVITNPEFQRISYDGDELTEEKAGELLEFVEAVIDHIGDLIGYELRVAEARRNKQVAAGELDEGQPLSASKTKTRVFVDFEVEPSVIKLKINTGKAADLPIEAAKENILSAIEKLQDKWKEKGDYLVRTFASAEKADKYWTYLSEILQISGKDTDELQERFPEPSETKSGRMAIKLPKEYAKIVRKTAGFETEFKTR